MVKGVIQLISKNAGSRRYWFGGGFSSGLTVRSRIATLQSEISILAEHNLLRDLYRNTKCSQPDAAACFVEVLASPDQRRPIVGERTKYALRNCAQSAILLALVVLSAPSWADPPLPTPGVPPKVEQKGFTNGVVSVSNPLAAEVGARVLQEGGNAVDAAAAIQFALNVAEPESSGIGGGGGLIVSPRP